MNYKRKLNKLRVDISFNPKLLIFIEIITQFFKKTEHTNEIHLAPLKNNVKEFMYQY